jgi:uncharacterized membrane protein YczE
MLSGMRSTAPAISVWAVGRLLLAHPVCGAGIALSIRSGLGAAPWDVFHIGLHRATGLSIGAATTATAAAAVLVALAAGVRPGWGTLVNAFLIGACVDLALVLVPAAPSMPVAAGYLAAAIVLLGLGTGLYLGAGLGSGPRDSLMVALARRPRWSISSARIAVELGALVAGLLLGGTLGAGTVVYAIAIGPVTRWGMDLFGESNVEAPCH